MRQARSRKAFFGKITTGDTVTVHPAQLGAFVAYAVFEGSTRPLAAQEFIRNGYSGTFPAEAVALETAASFIAEWLNPAAV